MKMRMVQGCVAAMLLPVAAALAWGAGEPAPPEASAPAEPPLVVLDIGHFIGSGGAEMPGRINGQRFCETEFWYRYCYDVKETITQAGYRCEVCNRGNAPKAEPLLGYAKRAGVVQLNHPDTGVLRYPSKHHADRVSAGMVSADFAVDKKAACAVFLHHNSSGSGWTTGASPSVVIHNKYNGETLADCLIAALDGEILNHGMDNKGVGCKKLVRCVDADRAAGWMNTCDDAGIPAAVIEAAFLNNKNHATFLAEDANARKYAQAIGHGIIAFLKKDPPHKPHLRENPDAPDQGSFGYAAESRRINVPGARLLVKPKKR
ncbi:MAG: N-acetylmuramoyl-L-alanine amidase [Akkermansia sp.]|nr:N-acetylmuramoyl-L-alanine amidase [Akkermansia sp.]